MKRVCAECFAAYDALANRGSGVLADPWVGVWRERVEKCGCAARAAAHAAGVAALVAVACPDCGAPAGQWCRRHGVTQSGALLMCPARYRLRDEAGVES